MRRRRVAAHPRAVVRPGRVVRHVWRTRLGIQGRDEGQTNGSRMAAAQPASPPGRGDHDGSSRPVATSRRTARRLRTRPIRGAAAAFPAYGVPSRYASPWVASPVQTGATPRSSPMQDADARFGLQRPPPRTPPRAAPHGHPDPAPQHVQLHSQHCSPRAIGTRALARCVSSTPRMLQTALHLRRMAKLTPRTCKSSPYAPIAAAFSALSVPRPSHPPLLAIALTRLKHSSSLRHSSEASLAIALHGSLRWRILISPLDINPRFRPPLGVRSYATAQQPSAPSG